MAGIGFELKKIFKEESLNSIIRGIGYSAIVTIGPTLLVIVTILFLYQFLDFVSLSYQEREILSSTILYAFIFSVILTAPFTAVLSRYIADKIYFEKMQDILPSYYSGLFLIIICAVLLAVPFLFHVYIASDTPLFFILFSFGLFISLILTFHSTNYLTATKDYKIIALYYLIGMITTFLISWFLSKGMHIRLGSAILYGLTMGFILIAALEFSYIKKYFPENSRNYTECFHYFIKFWKIFLSNLAYILGLYISNFIFWSKEEHIIIASSYISSPSYDMAACLAMFTNISMVVIFTVMAETKFHEIYQKYNEAVIGSTYHHIKLLKNRMFRLLIQQVTNMIVIQTIISSVIFLLAIIFLPMIGFNGQIMSIYPLLCAAYFVVFTMYCNIIFLYYFDDSSGALYSGITFLAMTIISMVISGKLSDKFYGIGLFIGAIAGWTFSYFRIRYLEKHFDRHIFCHVKVVEQQKGKRPCSIIYQKKGEKQNETGTEKSI